MDIILRLKNMNMKDITLQRIAKAIARWFFFDIPHRIAWALPLKFTVQNKKNLLKYKDIHKGKRCFIIANGPSLKEIDFSLLKNEITIGMNRIYLLEKTNGFMPNYLVCIDIPCQLKQFWDDYNRINIHRFYRWEARKFFGEQENLNYLRHGFSPQFKKDILKPIGVTRSVTYTCIQLAYYMGFNQIILIGKDHSYNISGKAGTPVKSDGAETNHFIDGYYKKGMKWDIPDYLSEELAYRLARKAVEMEGKEIFDATKDGKLNVFEKIKYEDLFLEGPHINSEKQ